MMKKTNVTETVRYNTIAELIYNLLCHLKADEHKNYESVKLYGNSQLMFDILKYIFQFMQDSIKIGYIDITSNWYDENEKQSYVLEISEDMVLGIQSVWNGNLPLFDESKFSICMDYCDEEIISSISVSGSKFVIGTMN